MVAQRCVWGSLCQPGKYLVERRPRLSVPLVGIIESNRHEIRQSRPDLPQPGCGVKRGCPRVVLQEGSELKSIGYVGRDDISPRRSRVHKPGQFVHGTVRERHVRTHEDSPHGKLCVFTVCRGSSHEVMHEPNDRFIRKPGFGEGVGDRPALECGGEVSAERGS